jgi:hypothetical protein
LLKGFFVLPFFFWALLQEDFWSSLDQRVAGINHLPSADRANGKTIKSPVPSGIPSHEIMVELWSIPWWLWKQKILKLTLNLELSLDHFGYRLPEKIPRKRPIGGAWTSKSLKDESHCSATLLTWHQKS